MNLPIVTLEAAREDITSIGAYLFKQSPAVAERFLACMNDSLQTVAVMPEIGRVYHGAVDGLRQIRVRKFENHLLFYRASKKHIELVRVIHGARDIPRLFNRL